MKILSKLFNGKSNPENVFILAIPLSVMGFLCVGFIAFLQWKINGDYWYTVIAIAGLLLLGFAGYPLLKKINKLHNSSLK